LASQTSRRSPESSKGPKPSCVDTSKRRTDEKAAELITEWKAERSYPFADEPTTVVENADRELYEVVAVSAASAVQDSDLRGRRMSLRLIR
jgi:hypothetical protein